MFAASRMLFPAVPTTYTLFPMAASAFARRVGSAEGRFQSGWTAGSDRQQPVVQTKSQKPVDQKLHIPCDDSPTSTQSTRSTRRLFSGLSAARSVPSFQAAVARDPSLVLSSSSRSMAPQWDWSGAETENLELQSGTRGIVIKYAPVKIKIEYQITAGCSNGNQLDHVGNHSNRLDCSKHNQLDNSGSHATGNLSATTGQTAQTAQKIGKRVFKGAVRAMGTVLPCLLA